MQSVRRKLLNLITLATIPLVVANVVSIGLLGNRLWRTSLTDIESITTVIHDLVENTLRESIVTYLRGKVESARDLMDVLGSEDPAELREPLLALSVADSGYIYVIDETGRIVIHPDPNTQDRVIPDVEPVRTQLARRNGYLEYVWQNSFEPEPLPKALFMSEDSDRGWIVAATAYRSEFVRMIDTERIADVLETLVFNTEAYATVLARDGTFIAHPEFPGGNVYDILPRPEAESLMERIFSTDSGELRYSWAPLEEDRFRPKLMFHRYLPDFDLVIATTVYLDTLRRPTVLIVTVHLAFAMALVAGVAAVALRVSHSVSDPVAMLASAVRREGTMPVRAEVAAAPEEVRTLVYGFNEFVDRIEEQRIEVAEREESLQRAVNEKSVLVREIHHRVKNNLQVIASLLNLQAGDVRDPEDARLFERSAERVISMAMVHEQLHHTEDLSLIPYDEYLAELLEHIRNAQGVPEITIDLSCDRVFLEIYRAVPCGLIVNELVTNALEHAFVDRAGGNVSVVFRRARDVCTLSVGDDGRGMEYGATPSLGLTLVDMLAKQLGATMETASGSGTVVTISFPV